MLILIWKRNWKHRLENGDRFVPMPLYTNRYQEARMKKQEVMMEVKAMKDTLDGLGMNMTLCHGDFHMKNMVYDEETGRLKGYPGYFREPHGTSIGLLGISKVTWQVLSRWLLSSALIQGDHYTPSRTALLQTAEAMVIQKIYTTQPKYGKRDEKLWWRHHDMEKFSTLLTLNLWGELPLTKCQ